ncbi:hypothetical protein KIN20_011748 [Parelaphostrongylus tenuis]|uniref:Uncharacterized protein n=1 Tax=Parelaphostrongylus tenuis TaxID=148309 RepID=A0AAD5MEI5_PARTN|nr:hypothetical protein KIN20_011748 [Parelaphostrongylus tenuis]
MLDKSTPEVINLLRYLIWRYGETRQSENMSKREGYGYNTDVIENSETCLIRQQLTERL